jgi:hypothetical protein
MTRGEASSGTTAANPVGDLAQSERADAVEKARIFQWFLLSSWSVRARPRHFISVES